MGILDAPSLRAAKNGSGKVTGFAGVGFIYTAKGFGPNTLDNAGITAAFNAAVAAGAGVVDLPAGNITLTASLPMASGVKYKGSGWSWTYVGIPDDGETVINTAIGTVLIGDGTFPAFSNPNGNAAQYASQILFSNAALTNVGISDVAMLNFSHGIKLGSNYNPGAFYSEFRNCAAQDCGWGFWFENMLHTHYDKLVSVGSTTGGQMYRSSSVSAVLQPANCTFGELVNTVPRPTNLKVRGIVISSANGTLGGFANGNTIQSNRFNSETLSVAATFTNASANIGVPDGTKFALWMPVAFTASANGFTANQVYVVTSIVGNVIQLSNKTYDAAIVANNNTGLTLTSAGFACFEMLGEDSASSVFLSGATLDLEAGGTTKAYLQNVANPVLYGNGVVNDSNGVAEFTIRNSQYGSLMVGGSARTDFDGQSTHWATNGNIGSYSQGTPMGMFTGNNRSLNLAQNTGGAGNYSFINQQPGGGCDFTLPGVPLGQKTTTSSTATRSLNTGTGGGAAGYSGAGAGTWALLTPSANLLGYKQDIFVLGAGALTVTSGGSNPFGFIPTATRSSYLLAGVSGSTQGGSLRLICAQDGSGGYTWAVLGLTNAT